MGTEYCTFTKGHTVGTQDRYVNTWRLRSLECAQVTYRQVLLVGQHGDGHGLQVGIVHQQVELFTRLVEAAGVGRVHHEQDCVGLKVVVAPELPDGGVPAEIPRLHGEVADRLCMVTADNEVGQHAAALALRGCAGGCDDPSARTSC